MPKGFCAVELILNKLITDPAGKILANSRLRAVSRRMGFNEAARGRIQTACSEMTSNQLKHASGVGLIQAWESRGRAKHLDLFALDYGPGIMDTTLAARDGYSTSGTLGKGIGGIRRMADMCEVYSIPESDARSATWHGTAVWARFTPETRLSNPADDDIRTGCFLRAMGDDIHNGDWIHYTLFGYGKVSWIHLDGLGHGRAAAEAVEMAGGIIDPGLPLNRTMELIDAALKGGRGAVGLAAEFDAEERVLRYCGVGDLRICHVKDATLKTLVLGRGILGHAHGTFKAHEVYIGDKQVVFSASDGIRAAWNKGDLPGLWRLHPQMIAFLLGNVMARENDDRSLFVLQLPDNKTEEDSHDYE